MTINYTAEWAAFLKVFKADLAAPSESGSARVRAFALAMKDKEAKQIALNYLAVESMHPDGGDCAMERGTGFRRKKGWDQ